MHSDYEEPVDVSSIVHTYESTHNTYSSCQTIVTEAILLGCVRPFMKKTDKEKKRKAGKQQGLDEVPDASDSSKLELEYMQHDIVIFKRNSTDDKDYKGTDCKTVHPTFVSLRTSILPTQIV